MKRCPTCKRTFPDDTLSFCLEDGTPLVSEATAGPDSQETLVIPSGAGTDRVTESPSQAVTQVAGASTIRASHVPAAQPYGAVPAQRKTWPWIVAILAVLLIVIVGLVVVVAVMPAMMRASNNGNRSQPTSSPSSSPWESKNDVPTDSDEVLSQLTKVERDWTEANFKGDKQAMERILADEYVGGESSQTKRQYIDNLTPDHSVQSWDLEDLTVDQNGDRATVTGRLIEETNQGTVVYDFTDKYVWRDHRWQAVSAQSSRVK